MYISKIRGVIRTNFFKILKSGHTLGTNFFFTYFRQKHGKNSAAALKK